VLIRFQAHELSLQTVAVFRYWIQASLHFARD
jgi:hypothetical protein